MTIHTRIAKQLYKGKANAESFIPLVEESRHKLIYNGDITSKLDIERVNNVLNAENQEYMIGRGLLMNPFLASELKGVFTDETEKRKIIKNFHEELFYQYSENLQTSHLLATMKSQWEYLSFLFENQHKVFKRIKKAKSIDHYNDAVKEVLKSKLLKSQ